jgi:hypothetical protein
MFALAHMPRGGRAITWLLMLVLMAYAVQLVAGVLPPDAGDQFEKFATNFVFLGCALLCGWRALAIREERVAWSLFAAGLLMWGLGNLYFTLALWDLAEIPIPSPADAGYLALYPFAYAGLVVLFRSRVARLGRNLWVDGLIAALSVAALAATALYEPVVSASLGTPLSVATNLTYPVADLLLVAFGVGAIAMTGWSLNGAWAWLAAGLFAFAVTDASYLYGTAAGTYHPGDVIDVGWPLAAFVIALAAWLPAPERSVVRVKHWMTITLPLVFGLAGLSLLVFDHFHPVNLLAVGLAAGAVLGVLGRLGLTFDDNVRVLASSRREALSDALTELGNPVAP